MKPLKPAPRKPAVIGVEWFVLSVILLVFASLLLTDVTNSSTLPIAARALGLIGGYIAAFILPGIFIICTYYRDFGPAKIFQMSFSIAIPLLIFRFMSMTLARLDCATDCAGGLPYTAELTISLLLPLILATLCCIVAVLRDIYNELPR